MASRNRRFEGILMLSREGTTVGLTFWKSREVAVWQRLLGCSSSNA
jgi:hypothetical protein